MTQWLNRSHPQTLQAGVILGYISAVFGLLFLRQFWMLLVFFGLGFGAFGTANNKRWGYTLLAVCASIAALYEIIFLVDSVIGRSQLQVILARLNQTVFPTALAAAVLHVQSRQYQKAWFE